jgi:pyridoxal phosphate enzyme (YggS family)
VIDIRANYEAVHSRVVAAAARAGTDPAKVRIIAVSKRHDAAVIDQAYAAGVRNIGENFAQELIAKRQQVDCVDTMQWHFIGRLQRNKVKSLIGQADLLHAVDSERLLREIDRRATEAAAVQDLLLAVNVAAETTKTGVAHEDLPPLIDLCSTLPGVNCTGLMTMPPLVDSPDANRVHFAALRALRDRHLPNSDLSMGTTSDYEAAVQEGATLIRVGTAIFGPRPERA